MRLTLLLTAFLALNVSAETYYIDDLVIQTSSNTYSSSCVTGAKHSILVTGSIGPDSTFAVGKLIDQREPCLGVDGEVISPIEVTLESGGGYLEDGYKLGKVFRDRGVTTIIPDDKMCASSCAVAFLGGTKRFVADKGSILFHAPYLKQMQLEGKERITCDLPKEELQALNDYYSSMTSVEVGDRLYERTMWYCSAENGWTIRGAAAAELYGIATEGSERTVHVLPSSTVEIKANYDAASNMILKDRNLAGAVIAFRQHLSNYPTSPYAPNAYYWLGEIFLFQGELHSAGLWFESTYTNYPTHSKAMFARYKLGIILHKLNENAKAREMLNFVAKSNSEAAPKARDYLKKIK